MAAVKSWDPDVKDKSGKWYWLNDWRRKKQEASASFTYRDLAEELSRLMHHKGKLPQVPSARMNSFITDLRADPDNADMTRDEVQKAWQ